MLSSSLPCVRNKQKTCAIFGALTAVLMMFELFWVLVKVCVLVRGLSRFLLLGRAVQKDSTA
jgi:hypothetical protein